MRRREFLIRSASGLGAAWLSSTSILNAIGEQTLPAKFSASDTVTLGSTGIKTSRLAMGTGTVGSEHHSHQTALGVKGLSDLLLNGYDHGLRFFDAADSYGSHPHVAEALKHVQRDKVTVLSKTWARDPATARADLDRFRRELGTDYIDILLLHCMLDGDWPERKKGAMAVISEAQEKGIVRTHGTSCHTLEALKTAARTPWVQVDLARINPAQVAMDADPQTVIGVLREMKAAGKGVIGMKILGAGKLRNKVDESLQFALSLDCVDCFTIGSESRDEMLDLVKKIPPASVRG
jgi:aryl-alcohol dehydrogenase-like predicted oxidoreductase